MLKQKLSSPSTVPTITQPSETPRVRLSPLASRMGLYGLIVSAIIIAVLALLGEDLVLIQTAMAISVAGAILLLIFVFYRKEEQSPGKMEPKENRKETTTVPFVFLLLLLLTLGFVAVVLSEKERTLYLSFGFAAAVHAGALAYSGDFESRGAQSDKKTLVNDNDNKQDKKREVDSSSPETLAAKREQDEKRILDCADARRYVHVVFDFDCTLTRRHYYLTTRTPSKSRSMDKRYDEFYPVFVTDPTKSTEENEQREVEFFFGPEERVQKLRTLLSQISGQEMEFCADVPPSRCFCHVSTRGYKADVERLLQQGGMRQYFSYIHSELESKVSKVDFMKRLCLRQIGPVTLEKEPFLKRRITGKSQYDSGGDKKKETDGSDETEEDNDSEDRETDDVQSSARGLSETDVCIYLDDDPQYYSEVNEMSHMITFPLQTPREKFHQVDPETGRRFQDGSENFTVELMEDLGTLVLEVHTELVRSITP